MKWDKLLSRLAEEFDPPAEGSVLGRGRGEIDFAEIVSASLPEPETEAERDRITAILHENEDDVQCLAGDLIEPMLEEIMCEFFVAWWQSFGPITSGEILYLMQGPECAFVLKHCDFGWEGIATVSEREWPGVWGQVLFDYVLGTADAPPYWPWGSLPTGLENHRPDLLSPDEVRRVCRTWVDLHGDRGWGELREEVLVHARHKFPSFRTLGEIFGAHASMEDLPEGPAGLQTLMDRWEARLLAEGASLSAEDRDLIFSNYFAMAYGNWLRGFGSPPLTPPSDTPGS